MIYKKENILYRVMKCLNIKFYKGMKIKNTSKKKYNKKYSRKMTNRCKIRFE